jgi:hypothetical protein
VGEERREGKKKQETTRKGKKVPNFENKSENQKIRWKKMPFLTHRSERNDRRLLIAFWYKSNCRE